MTRNLIRIFLIIGILIFTTQGCRQEVCRKKRSPSRGSGLVLLRGCSGQTAAWVTQMAFCLNVSVIDVAFTMRDWYETAYQICTENCGAVRAETTQTSEVITCTNCFVGSLTRSTVLDNFENISITAVTECVSLYVVPFLNDAQPTLQVQQPTPSSNSLEGCVALPREGRPQTEEWWALAVRLPCKPPVFQYFDANCINSFGQNVRARDFLLAQNEVNSNENIKFLVRFNEACRFTAKDIKIVWEKSVPGFAFPQISSFPSSFPPGRMEYGNITYDVPDNNMYRRIIEPHLQEPSRKKRSPAVSSAPELGIAMPCQVEEFKVTDSNGNPIVMKTNGPRHLILPEAIDRYNKSKITLENYQIINFTINFGYEKTGCVFSSNEPSLVVAPPPGWLEQTNRITCYTCRNAASEEECLKSGTTRCQRGEICQSEVRQVTPNRISISKMCKQSNACKNNWIHNNRLQCRPGRPASTCRCCCSSDKCNQDAYHCT